MSSGSVHRSQAPNVTRQEAPPGEGDDDVLSGRRLKDAPGSTRRPEPSISDRGVDGRFSSGVATFLGVDWTERGVTSCVDALGFCLERG
jgi:hypothetical protein